MGHVEKMRFVMTYITAERFSNRINSVLHIDKEEKGIVKVFKEMFGESAIIQDFVIWLRQMEVKNNRNYEDLMLATSDGELTQALIDAGANPHTNDDKALSLAAEDGDDYRGGGKVESLKVLVKYRPSLQALENALNCTLNFSWSSNPRTEALLREHIEIAKKENPEERKERAKSVPKVRHRIVMGPVVA